MNTLVINICDSIIKSHRNNIEKIIDELRNVSLRLSLYAMAKENGEERQFEPHLVGLEKLYIDENKDNIENASNYISQKAKRMWKESGLELEVGNIYGF
ncbi:hypothetical protein OKZ62_001730 [Vibrio navarrensis]|nr:hypothetical protein [Vibrio navarrensis]